MQYADSVGVVPTVEGSQPEPKLIDIKEVLVNKQTTVATILGENQELKQEILELKSALNVNQRETEKLKTQLNKAKKANDTLKNELNCTRIKLKDQIEETYKLDEKNDDLGQYSLKNSLEILGVPEDAYTNRRSCYSHWRSHKCRYQTGRYRNITQTQKKNHQTCNCQIREPQCKISPLHSENQA